MAALTLEQAQAMMTPLFEAGRFAEAEEICRRLLSLHPDHPGLRVGLGILAAAQGRADEAIGEYRRALQIQPNNMDAHYHLGVALTTRGSLDEAIASFRRAVQIRPTASMAYGGLADALCMRGEFSGAMTAARQALALQPENASAHCTVGLIQLLNGDFQHGWREYEWRFKTVEWPKSFPAPTWHGEPLAGKTLLLYADQGVGDTIQFVRYVPLVVQRGGRVLLQVQDELLTLFNSIAGIEVILPRSQTPPPFDVQCPLGSLPFIFQTDLNSIPSPGPYIAAPEADISRASHMWDNPGAWGIIYDHVIRVGVAWAGNPRHRNDRRRSMTETQFKPFSRIPGVGVQILQRAAVGPKGIESYPIVDFADTAGAIAHLDLVISVDTAIAHLAAAMGKPTWILLPHPPDWRWMLERSDSPWYPSVRLFRQTTFADWTGVVEHAAAELAKLAATRRSGGPGPTPV